MSRPLQRPFWIGAIALFALGSGVLAQEQSSPTADNLFQMGQSRLSLGKYQDAESAFRRLAEIEPDKSRGIIGIAQVYLSEKREDEALRFLQSETQKTPARMDLHFAIGNVAQVLGKYDLAISEFMLVLERIDKDSPVTAEIYFHLGDTYRRKGDLDFAIDLYQKAQKLMPSNPIITNAVAFALESAGRREAAEAEYRKLIAADPKNALAMNNLAFLLADGGTDLAMALAYAHRARQLVPNETSFADTLGWVYFKMNNAEDAVAIFREIVQKDPARAVYHYHLAAALDQKGELAEARKELQIALKNNPSKEDEQKIQELLQKVGQ